MMDINKYLTGNKVSEIRVGQSGANVITTFEFWHEFLHGNPEDRVKGIFDKLLDDFQIIESL